MSTSGRPFAIGEALEQERGKWGENAASAKPPATTLGGGPEIAKAPDDIPPLGNEQALKENATETGSPWHKKSILSLGVSYLKVLFFAPKC